MEYVALTVSLIALVIALVVLRTVNTLLAHVLQTIGKLMDAALYADEAIGVLNERIKELEGEK